VAPLDLELGTDATGAGLDGVELVGPLRAQGWTVLVVTGTAELDRVAAAVAAGAASWMVKGASLAELVHTTVELAAGRGRLPESQRRAMLQRHRTAQHTAHRSAERLGKLSPKQREVLDRLAAGADAATVARQTHTSIRTVRAQIRSILTKLDVNSQGAATAILREHANRAPPIRASLWRRMCGPA